MKPNRTAIMALVLAGALTAAGCGESSTSEPETVTIADLVGSWIATSLVLTNKANTTQSMDIVAAGGEVRITVLSDGRARTWTDVGTLSDEWDALLTMSGNELTSTPAEATRPVRRYTVALANGQLTLTSTDGTFDFTLSGATPVPVSETVVMVRN